MQRFHTFLSLVALTPLAAMALPVTQGPTTWTACPPEYPAVLQCAAITVPLDYTDCGGETLSLTLLKLPARNSTARQGSIVWQDGGPGIPTSSALISAANYDGLLLGEVQTYFDLIVADPRGVGINHPVKCDPELTRNATSYFPRTEDEYEETVARLGAMGQSCYERTGKVMDYMDTHAQAKDIEAVRIAIGEGPLNYYGLSWGTMRGYDYAALYPDNVGSMVLDGLVDHSSSTAAMSSSAIQSTSLTTRRMLDWMHRNETSALYGRDAVKIWRELIERANENPLAAPDCVESGLCFPHVSGDDLRTAMAGPLGRPNYLWPEASENLLQAYDKNNASAFSYPMLEDETGLLNSQFAIICHDWQFSDDWEDFKLLQYMGGAFSLDPVPTTAGRTWALACARWPANVTNPPTTRRVENSKSAMPILLVHALYDAATGYDQALGVHRNIDQSVLLTRYGEGHGSLEWPEAAGVVMDYFIRGIVPSPTALVEQPMSATVTTDFELMGWKTG